MQVVLGVKWLATTTVTVSNGLLVNVVKCQVRHKEGKRRGCGSSRKAKPSHSHRQPALLPLHFVHPATSVPTVGVVESLRALVAG